MKKARKGPSDWMIQRLQEQLTSAVLTPDHPEYDLRRNDRHLMVDSYPLLIVRVKQKKDIVETVKFVRRHDLPLAVRGGGHSTRSLGAGHGAVLIDLSEMKQIEVDVEKKTAKIETGATWGDVAGKLQPHNLALTSGDNATVGVGGISQGSGIGYMVRKYGLTSDRIIGVDLVTAAGEMIHASTEENPELFWGIRGGGGNFGIASTVEFSLHDGGEVLGGSLIYDGVQADELVEWVRLAHKAPNDLTVMIHMMSAAILPFVPESTQDKKVAVLNLCYAGDLAKGEEVLAPFRQAGTVLVDTLQAQPYMQLLESHEGRSGYVGQSAYMQVFDRERAQVLADIVNEEETPLSPAVGIRILGGAVADLPADATTYAHRDKPYLVQVHNFYMATDQAPAAQAKMESTWEKVAPYSEGTDINLIGNQGPVPLKEIYGPDALRRLVKLKQQYDSENIFNQNINIPPDTQIE